MFFNKSDYVPFEETIQPLTYFIDIMFDIDIKHKLDNLFMKYRDSIFTNVNATTELNTIIKEAIAKILTNLSDKYKKKLYQYYTDDGIIQCIYRTISGLSRDYIEIRFEQEKV